MIDVSKILNKFIYDMGYLKNEHVLGAFFYGSYLTGFYDQFSDIDLQVILDNNDLKHYIRGQKYVDGVKVEYFERPIKYAYALVQKEVESQNAIIKNCFGKSKILFDKTGRLKKLQDYTLEKYSMFLPDFDEEKAREYVSILNNRIKDLKRACLNNSDNFTNLYYLLIEEIRQLYHKLNCITAVNADKAYRAYLNDEYRKSLSFANPDEKFVSMYLQLITDYKSCNEEKLDNIQRFYNYVKKDVTLNEDEYRIVLII